MENHVANTSANNEPFFGIQRVYLKGQSLEIPQGAQVFLLKEMPPLNLNMEVRNEKLADNVYEVVLRTTLSAEMDGKVYFLLEVDQSGIFEIRNVNDQQLADLLEIAAPSILAPYLRAHMSDMLSRATLPSFYLPEVNFAAAAQQKRQQEAASRAPTLH